MGLQAGEAKRDLGDFLLEDGGWLVLAAARADHRPREAVMRSNQVQDEIAVVVGKLSDALVVLDEQQGAEFVPVAVEQAIVDRTLGLRVRVVRWRVERALPSLSALAFIVQTSRQCQKLLAPLIQAKGLRQSASALFGPTLMLVQKLRIGRGAVLLGRRIVPLLVHDEPARRLTVLRHF